MGFILKWSFFIGRKNSPFSLAITVSDSPLSSFHLTKRMIFAPLAGSPLNVTLPAIGENRTTSVSVFEIIDIEDPFIENINKNIKQKLGRILHIIIFITFLSHRQ